MKKIIGIQELKGDYEGRAYHSYRFYLQVENRENDRGVITENIKVKKSIVDEILNKNQYNDVSDLLGLNVVNIYYDSYKNVVDIIGE